jgi:hypothetical protein
VDADHRTVADGVVVRLERGVALRVVADVHERLAGIRRHADRIQKLARSSALLVHGQGHLGAAVAVADRVGASSGDSREEGLSSKGAIDPALDAQAISGDTAQNAARLRS